MVLMPPPIEPSQLTQCRRFEVPTPPAANSVRNFKSKSGTRIIELLVPLCFRSSCQSKPRCITNFGNGALVSNHSEHVVSIPESADLAHSPTDMSVDWIRANAVAALVSFILGVATFGLRQMLGLPDPEAGALARASQSMAEVFAAIAGLAVYGG